MSSKNQDKPQFPEVVVVEASAGSGKTYALAKRFLQLLINSRIPQDYVPLRAILAITFTNKATVEMKERILEFLKRIAFDCFESEEQAKDILDSLGVDKKFAQKKARLIMDELIKHYSFFQVQTIDSFINALLLGCAMRIDRSSSFSIRRDYSQYLAYCLDLVIDQASYDPKVLTFLKEFVKHYLLVENQKGWFPKDDILALMESLFQLSNKYGQLFYEYAGKGADVIKKKKALFGKIQELFEEIPEGFNKSAQSSLNKFVTKSNEIFELSDVPAKFQQPQVPMNKGKAASKEFSQKWKKIHTQLKEITELEATVSYNPYIRLFNGLLGFFQDISKKEDMVFLEELNRKARLLFGEEGFTVAELYYRLATRFKHYLIDEFQDTSRLQWRNLEAMVQEGLSTGGSLFYVGDKKQAIYRFRGGEVELFDKVRRGFSQFNVKEHHLTKNWRSQKAIVEFNNQVFSKDNIVEGLRSSGIAKELADDNEAIDEITSVFSDAVQEYRPENECGYVEVKPIGEGNQQERNKIIKKDVLELIKDLRKRFNYADIAVLTRDNNEVELLTSWLLEAGVAVESEKTLNVLEHHLIRELISLLGFLSSPIDDLSFAAFILGDISESITAISKDKMRDFILDLHAQGQLSDSISLYNLFRAQYPKVWQSNFQELFKVVGFISIYELLIRIYERFDLMNKFPKAQAFFMKLLELVKKNEDEHQELSGFLTYLKNAPQEELYVNVIHSDSVRVLTIHKAKGLEFPVVVIPFLRMDISPETGGRGTSSYIVDEAQDALGLVRITKYYRAYSKKLQDIYTASYKKACIDELNGLYVALTRAQYELYVFIPAKSGTAKNKAKSFIPESPGNYGKKQKYKISKNETKQELIDIKAPEYRDWLKSLKDEFFDVAPALNRKARFEGIIMHEILSKVSNTFKGSSSDMIKKAIQEVSYEHSGIDCAYYQKKIADIINHGKLNHIFYIPDGGVDCEKEVVNRFGDTKRIDRVIIKEKEVWVIDYKSSSQDKDKHKRQLNEYVEIMSEFYPDKKIKGFLLYFDEMKLQEL